MRKKGIRKPRPWDKDYAPYGRYEGERGSPEQWRAAFGARFTAQEIKEIIGEESPWAILGLKIGASQEDIKSAFRVKAMETHPDRHPELDGSAFRKVKAAFDKLTI